MHQNCTSETTYHIPECRAPASSTFWPLEGSALTLSGCAPHHRVRQLWGQGEAPTQNPHQSLIDHTFNILDHFRIPCPDASSSLPRTAYTSPQSHPPKDATSVRTPQPEDGQGGPQRGAQSMNVWAGASTLMQERPFSVRARDGKKRSAASAWSPAPPGLHVLVQNSKESNNSTFRLGLQVIRKLE